MKKVFILITVLITVLTVGCARTENDILEYHEQTPSVTDSETKILGLTNQLKIRQKLMGYKRQRSLKRLKSLQTKLLIRITSS